MTKQDTSDASQWLVKTREGEFGPISRTQMERLVKRGKIPPETPIRREDDQNWIRSDQVNRYDSQEPANVSAPEQHSDASAKPNRASGGPTNMASEAATNAAASMKGMLNVAADASKLAILKTRDLPAANAAIARKAIEAGLVPETDPLLVQIKKTELEIAELNQPIPLADSETVRQKASRLGQEAKRKLRLETTRQRLGKEHVALGKSIQAASTETAPPALQTELLEAAKVSEVITSLEHSIESRPGDKKKAIFVAVIVGVLLLFGVGMYFFGGGGDSSMAFSSADSFSTQQDRLPAIVPDPEVANQIEATRRKELRQREEQKRIDAENTRKRIEAERLALAKQEKQRKEREERKRAEEEQARREAAAKAETERKRILARQQTIENAMKQSDDWLLVRRPSADSGVSGPQMQLVQAGSFKSLGPVTLLDKTVSPIIGSFIFSSLGRSSSKQFGVISSPGVVWNPVVNGGLPVHDADDSIIYSADRIRCLKIVDGDLVRGVVNWTSGKEEFEGRITSIGLVDRFQLVSWIGNTLTMRNPSNPENPIVEIDLVSGDFFERPAGDFEKLEGAVRISDSLLLQPKEGKLRFVDLASHEIRDIPNKQYFPHPAVPENKEAIAIPLIKKPRIVNRQSWKQVAGNNVKMLDGDICVAVTVAQNLLAVHVPTLRTKSFDLGFGDIAPIKGRQAGRVTILDSIGKQVVCQIHFDRRTVMSDSASEETENGKELHRYKRVDLSSGEVTPLPSSCMNATWIDENHFVYLISKGGVSDIGVWLHDVELNSQKRLSARTQFGEFNRTSDNKTMFADIDGWKRVDISSGVVRSEEALADATQVIKFEVAVDLDLNANIESAWGTWVSPSYFAVSQESIQGFGGKDVEFAELVSRYDGTVGEALENILATQAGSNRCLDMVKYVKLIVPVISKMAEEGISADRISGGSRQEFPVADQLASCVDDDLLRIAIYEKCFQYASRSWFRSPVSDAEKEKVEKTILRTVDKAMRDRRIKAFLIDCRLRHNTKTLTSFGTTVLKLFSSLQ